MALVISDRVKETTTTTGTGTYSLGGAVTGFETFTANLSNSDTTYYACSDGTDFEVGLGTFTSSGTTLARTTILASSNSNNAVSWSSGTRTIFCTLPAAKAVFLDASGNANLAGDIIVAGEVDGASLDISGNADIDGTLEADAITVNGTALNTVIAGVTVTNATNAVNSTHVNVADNENANEENLITFIEDASATGNVGLESDGDFSYNPSTGTVSATIFKGNIDAVDGDFDGTLEADAITLNGTAITATATLDTGISNNNVPKFTTGVADDDFLRVAGTVIEGRSAAEVLSDIGGQASLTFGISNTNAVKVDSASVADDEYARFTANGLESRSTSEVLSDIGATSASDAANEATALAIALG
jgi:cytoskeletal protein CcmA (bactofilin family)